MGEVKAPVTCRKGDHRLAPPGDSQKPQLLEALLKSHLSRLLIFKDYEFWAARTFLWFTPTQLHHRVLHHRVWERIESKDCDNLELHKG